MTKRLLSCAASDFAKMSAADLKGAIRASEGRVVLCETIVAFQPAVLGLTNAELAAAFSADMICLNAYDALTPSVQGLPGKPENPIKEVKRLIGRPVGINLEPIAPGPPPADLPFPVSKGRQALPETFEAAQRQGADFVCLTGNPGSGVTNAEIEKAVSVCKAHFSGLVIAGKMHSSGVDEDLFDTAAFESFVKAGADIILIPAPGTVPGVSEADAAEAVKVIHRAGALALSAIGTSQESADTATIREIALSSKRAGFDIQHIGDAGLNGVAYPANIMAMSVAIRGERHTWYRMAQSVMR